MRSDHWTWQFPATYNSSTPNCYTEIIGGSGFYIPPSTCSLPGSNDQHVMTYSSLFQKVTLPATPSGIGFGIQQLVLGEMNGTGNYFGLMVCSADNGCPTSTPADMVRFEIHNCNGTDTNCSAGSWLSRLVVSTQNGTVHGEIEMLIPYASRLPLMELWITGDTMQFQAHVSTPCLNRDIVCYIRPNYTLQVSNPGVHFDKLNGYLANLYTACITCNRTSTSSFASIYEPAYRPSAPAIEYFGIPSLIIGAICIVTGSICFGLLISYNLKHRHKVKTT